MQDPDALSEMVAELHLLREAIAKSPVACCVFDEQDRLINQNRSYGDLYDHYPDIESAFDDSCVDYDGDDSDGGVGVNYAELVYEALSESVPEQQLDAAVAACLQAQREADGTPVEQDYGKRGVFRVIKYKLSNGAVAGMAIDVTELKEREAQLDAARIEAEKMGKVKSDFLAHMSHELRTPLNAIMGFTELTRMTLDETAQSKQMTYLRHVLDSGKHLVSLIDNLLDLSRIEANAQELNEAVCSVNGILRAAASILAPMAAQKDIRLELRRCPPDLHVMADERAIRQIIVNLATNALQYTSPGGHVVFEAMINAAGETELKVEDNGDGIAAEELEMILEPFVRASKHSIAALGGAGLGLSIVNAFVSLHGAHFDLESVEGEGTCATVILPAFRTLSVAGVPIAKVD